MSCDSIQSETFITLRSVLGGISGGLALLLSIILIVLFFSVRVLRSYPNNLILWNVLSDISFTSFILTQELLIPQKLLTGTACIVLACIYQFLNFASVGWNMVISIEMIRMLRNPFQQKLKMREKLFFNLLYHVVIWSLCLLSAGLVIIESNHINSNAGYCYISEFRISRLFFQIPVLICIVFSIFTLFFAVNKIRKGLQSTLSERFSLILRLFIYTLAFIIMWTIVIIARVYDFLHTNGYIPCVPTLKYIVDLLELLSENCQSFADLFFFLTHTSILYTLRSCLKPGNKEKKQKKIRTSFSKSTRDLLHSASGTGEDTANMLSTPLIPNDFDKIAEINTEGSINKRATMKNVHAVIGLNIDSLMRRDIIKMVLHTILHHVDMANENYEIHVVSRRNSIRRNSIVIHTNHTEVPSTTSINADNENKHSKLVIHTHTHKFKKDDQKEKIKANVKYDGSTTPQSRLNGFISRFASVKSVSSIAHAPKIFAAMRALYLDRSKLESFSDSFDLDFMSSIIQHFSEGKSGSFFLVSHDRRFVIKTINDGDMKSLLEIANNLYIYMKNTRDKSLIPYFLGCYSLSMYEGAVIHFVIMNNILPLPCKQRFDIKGSWVKRKNWSNDDEEGGGLGLDLDFLSSVHSICLSGQMKNDLLRQLKQDTAFLSSIGLMDYSLLVGIFNMNNHEVIDDDWKIRSAYPANDDTTKLYFIGIIDILQLFNLNKKSERFLKTYILRQDPQGISSQHPGYYANRFMVRMSEIFE